jgi:septum formation protein
MRLILASNSKTRKDIFDMVGWKYEVLTSNVEENSNSLDPKQYVIDLSRDKANSVASQITDKALIVSADSIIYMDNKRFEKPKSKEEGFDNIKKMSGKVNYAITGVTIKDLYQNKEISFTDITEVYFKNVSDKDIDWYVENEKYLLNRAGYSIAGKTSIFIDKLVGDYYNILGMPISKLYSKLNELGYTISNFDMKE